MCVTLVETQFYSHVVAKFCHKLYSTRAVNTEGQGGRCPPPVIGRSVDPIPTGGGQIMPKHYYLTPRIFRPSYGPALHLLKILP